MTDSPVLINATPVSSSESITSSKPVYNVLIAATGSVACIKLSELHSLLTRASNSQYRIRVKIIATAAALHFLDRDTRLQLGILTDEDETRTWQKRGDPVLHIELRKWADLVVVAPLSANTLAKIANGICDNLVTMTLRAWDMKRPRVICPAMNTFMWDHPHTAKQLEMLEKELGYVRVGPIVKTLMCGDTGNGAMSTPQQIADKVFEIIDTKIANEHPAN
ncbi:putative phosphopantothenoylcysteine decarboxylase [Ramicandelaber brevisporus]|nr:putative phosphopantothenoylcysteine decarboxylase [Ramicandelaber brevisporus]